MVSEDVQASALSSKGEQAGSEPQSRGSDSSDGGKLASTSIPRGRVSRNRANNEKNSDECSFALFSDSFETISEAGQELSPVNANDTFAGPVLSPTPGRLQRRPVDIELPKLKHGGSSECSLGDISPIKVAFHGAERTAIDRRGAPPHFISSSHETPHPYPPDSLSNPFYVIRSSRQLLKVCKYPLPCLQDLCRVNVSGYGHIRHYRETEDLSDMVADNTIAIRRIEAAICAFGGSVRPDQNPQKMSIFRQSRDAAQARQHYERELPKRYFLSGSRVSWEVESEPPISGANVVHSAASPRQSSSAQQQQGQPKLDTSFAGVRHAAKGKYRCKRCGQPKMNHTCPYRPSLQRSIGVMVYPAVNSYTAAEPGIIAPPLNKMNNFVSYDSEHGSHDQEHAPAPVKTLIHPSTVTPEALRSSTTYLHSPRSPLSSEDSHGAFPRTGRLTGQKRSHDTANDGRLLDQFPFVASLTLRPEHYRAVTPTDSSTAFQYPPIPLTFPERKRLADTLFCLSREIPCMTQDCAAVLYKARENNDWDQAVAELLTQVVIGLYCWEGDTRMDGLRRYLLALGISC